MNAEISQVKNVNKVEKETPFARVYPCEKLSLTSPLLWLWKGTKNFFSMPIISLFYGACFMAMALAIEWLVILQGSHLVILPSLVLFVLIGPFLALGLYEASWEKSRGHKPSLFKSITAIRRNTTSQWAFSILLCVFMILWLRVASLIHALYPIVNNAPINDYLPFLITGSLVGFVFLSLVFAISAFSIPLMLERRVDMMTAVFTSMNAVKSNLLPMGLWGLTILTLTGLAYLTPYSIGFVFIMPILGYATWHSYRQTILTKNKEIYHRHLKND